MIIFRANEMTAMLDPSSCKDHGETSVTVSMGVTHTTAKNDHCIIKHPSSFEPIEKGSELFHTNTLLQRKMERWPPPRNLPAWSIDCFLIPTHLTASANGVDTSPVVRGIYVSEKILGYSPPPPPPDVPEIESDVSDAKSIRERLEKHHEVASCANCHRKIDPLGFRLENYDAIGGYRERYPDQIKIDSSGELLNGKSFQTPADFRGLLALHRDEFTRSLTEKMLAYALGRELEFGDREVINEVTSNLRASGGGMKDLIKAVVLSKSFGKN